MRNHEIHELPSAAGAATHRAKDLEKVEQEHAEIAEE